MSQIFDPATGFPIDNLERRVPVDANKAALNRVQLFAKYSDRKLEPVLLTDLEEDIALLRRDLAALGNPIIRHRKRDEQRKELRFLIEKLQAIQAYCEDHKHEMEQSA